MSNTTNLVVMDAFIKQINRLSDNVVSVSLITYDVNPSSGENNIDVHEAIFFNKLASVVVDNLNVGDFITVKGRKKITEINGIQKHEVHVERLYLGTFNMIKINGYVGKKEIKGDGASSTVTTLRIATHDYIKSKKTGDFDEETDWHSVVCFNKVAEAVNEVIDVGDLVSVVGKLKTKKFNDKTFIEIVAENIKLIRKKGEKRGLDDE